MASHDAIAHQPWIPNPPLFVSIHILSCHKSWTKCYCRDILTTTACPLSVQHRLHTLHLCRYLPQSSLRRRSVATVSPYNVIIIFCFQFKNNLASSPLNLPRSSRLQTPTSESASEGKRKRQFMPGLASSKDTGSTCPSLPNPARVSSVKLEPNLSQSHTASPVTEPSWKDDRSDGLALPVKIEGHREPSSSPAKSPQKLVIAAADAPSMSGSVVSGIPQPESNQADTFQACSPCPETETVSTLSGEATVSIPPLSPVGALCDVSTNLTDVYTPTSAVASSSITQRRSRRRSKSRKAMNIHRNINAVDDDSAITRLSKWYLDVDESQNLVLNAIDDSNESVIRSIIKRRLQPRKLLLKEGYVPLSARTRPADLISYFAEEFFLVVWIERKCPRRFPTPLLMPCKTAFLTPLKTLFAISELPIPP